MLNATTIRNTIDDVKRAAVALGVSPYGDDGLTFTRREFETETKGAHVFDSLETLRDRHAVVVDHSETFTHPAILTVSIDPLPNAYYYHGDCIKSLRVSMPMSKHDIVLMLQTDNPIAVFTSINAKIAKFFADNDVNAKNMSGCYYSRYYNKATISAGDITVMIKYTPEFEGVRYFYRFDLCGYLRRQEDRINDAIIKCTDQAAKYQALADAKTAQAAKLRKLVANLDRQ